MFEQDAAALVVLQQNALRRRKVSRGKARIGLGGLDFSGAPFRGTDGTGRRIRCRGDRMADRQQVEHDRSHRAGDQATTGALHEGIETRSLSSFSRASSNWWKN